MSLDFDPMDNISDRVLPEDQTRRKLRSFAKRLGCLQELNIIFDKYDRMLKTCSNEKERKDIGKLGAVEVYWLIGGGRDLTIDGELVAIDKYDQPDKKSSNIIIL